MSMIRVIAYFRVSTRKQAVSGLGIEAQREAVARWMPADAALFNSFTERESGRRADRPKLKAAIDEAILYGAILVVARLDRLTRSAKFLETLLERVEKDGLKLAFCDVPAVEGPSGMFILRALAAVAQLEAEMASRRTRDAMAAKKASGHVFPGRKGHTPPPELTAMARQARIVKANERAERYRTIMAEVADLPYAKAADVLNGQGVPTATGKGIWTAAAVWRMQRRLAA